MRIALMQFEAIALSVEENLKIIETQAVEAKRAQADLLITPELFVTGYEPAALRKWLSPQLIFSIPQGLSAIAKNVGIALVASFPRHLRSEKYTIGAGLWDSDGNDVLQYDKLHLWGDEEPQTFVPGEQAPKVVSWNGWNVGFQVCYDIEFPEPSRYLAENGVDLILVPTAIDAAAEYVTQTVVPSRAAENNVVVAYTNYPSSPQNENSFIGQSVVATIGANILGRGGASSELVLVDLPATPDLLNRDEPYLTNRRPDMYRSWSTDADSSVKLNT